MRKSEILSLRWQHVDFERAALRLPDSKTGAKVVPLGAPAPEVLAALPRDEDASPFVFPAGRGKGHWVGLPAVWRMVAKAAKLQGFVSTICGTASPASRRAQGWPSKRRSHALDGNYR